MGLVDMKVSTPLYVEYQLKKAQEAFLKARVIDDKIKAQSEIRYWTLRNKELLDGFVNRL